MSKFKEWSPADDEWLQFIIGLLGLHLLIILCSVIIFIGTCRNSILLFRKRNLHENNIPDWSSSEEEEEDEIYYNIDNEINPVSIVVIFIQNQVYEPITQIAEDPEQINGGTLNTIVDSETSGMIQIVPSLIIFTFSFNFLAIQNQVYEPITQIAEEPEQINGGTLNTMVDSETSGMIQIVPSLIIFTFSFNFLASDDNSLHVIVNLSVAVTVNIQQTYNGASSNTITSNQNTAIEEDADKPDVSKSNGSMQQFNKPVVLKENEFEPHESTVTRKFVKPDIDPKDAETVQNTFDDVKADTVALSDEICTPNSNCGAFDASNGSESKFARIDNDEAASVFPKPK